MTSVIGTPFARAPRNVRSKNPAQLLLKAKETITTGSTGVFQNSKFYLTNIQKSYYLFALIIVSDVVTYMDKFIELVQSNSLDRPSVLILCTNLKTFGSQLEIHYKGNDVVISHFITT